MHPHLPAFIHRSRPLSTHPRLIHASLMHPCLCPCVLCPHPHVSDTSASPHTSAHTLGLGHICIPSHLTPHPHPCMGACIWPCPGLVASFFKHTLLSLTCHLVNLSSGLAWNLLSGSGHL